jgi:hypothetical protein
MVSSTLYLWDCYNQRYTYSNFILCIEDWAPGYWPSEIQSINDLPANIVRILVVLN